MEEGGVENIVVEIEIEGDESEESDGNGDDLGETSMEVSKTDLGNDFGEALNDLGSVTIYEGGVIEEEIEERVRADKQLGELRISRERKYLALHNHHVSGIDHGSS